MIKLIDTHCHLNDKAFLNDVSEVIKRAHESGVYKMLVMGVCEKSSFVARKLADQFDGVYALAGFQPQETPYPHNLDFITTLVTSDKVVGIGEIGIDLYWKDNKPLAAQKDLFIKQLELAKKHNLPVSIHARSAIHEVVSILKNYPTLKGVIHCFTEGVSEAKAVLGLENFYFGIGGVITYKNAVSLKEAIKIIPLSRIVLETDAPYLAPQLYRGKRNEPSFLVEVAQELARLKNTTLENVAQTTTSNACFIFNFFED